VTDDRLDVIDQSRRYVHALRFLLQLDKVFAAQAGTQLLQKVATVLPL